MMGFTDYAGWTSCASNEYGVSVVTGITTDCNIDAQAADPFVYDGISEEVIAKVLCSTAGTAKEAVDILCSIYDETGAETAEIVFITDPDGAWVVENFTGHEYVAKKLPDDKIATFSNDPIIRTADPEDPDTIVSEKLLALPEENDFAVFDDNNQLEFLIEYQGIQHYKPKSIFGGMSGLRKQQYYDMLKRQYCKKHNIKLILIPYWDQAKINYDYIMNLADIF